MISRIPSIPEPPKRNHPQSFADSPFDESICLTVMSSKFVFLTIRPYDGTNDPNNHIAHYKQRMQTVAVHHYQREACMCKGFGSSLASTALQWFIGLPNSSISTFTELHHLFFEQFSSSRKISKRSDDLYSIQQFFDEPLRDFPTRFNREKVSIPYCNQDTTISAFRKGLLRESDL